MGAVLRSLLVTLAEHGPELAEQETARLGAVTVDLVSTFLTQLENIDSATSDGHRPASADAIKAYVDARLNDVTLSPQTIAGAHHISVRYLHRIFQQRGESVAGWIRRRRLERCRQDL
jgi:AraC-like DNA-binding protein